MQSYRHRHTTRVVVPSLRFVLLTLIICALAPSQIQAFANKNKQGVLVLTTGRVISGRLDQNAGGFIVHSVNGNVQVPFERVRVRAANLHEAYERMLSSYPNPSPQTHIALANWCMTQQMYEETKVELRSALKLNPTNTEARNMLRRLEEILSPSQGAAESKTMPGPKTDDGFEPPPASSLAGIPRDAAIEYVTRVQPLMMNSCALAGCHAAGSATQFQLHRVRSGQRSSRALTERNLAATLKQIDHRDADNSPLIALPRGNHGRKGRPVLAGSRSSAHYQLLRTWIRKVTAATTVKASTKNQRSQSKNDQTAGVGRKDHNFTVQPGRRDSTLKDRGFDGSGFTVESKPQASQNLDHPGSASKLRSKSSEEFSGGDPLLREILRQERRDAFDPAEFNRQSNGERR